MSVSAVVEANFDGIVGPTHTFAGLATGNLAAAANRDRPSNPRAAALQGIGKMRRLVGLGLVQGVFPPHERPHVPTLRRLGFTGPDHAVLARAAAEAPDLMRAVSSASAMWTANAATVSAGSETTDGRVHLTPANLVSHFHRSIEAATTARILAATFPEGPAFAHHDPLPSVAEFADEGAANHTRLGTPGRAGVSVFVYGRGGDGPDPRRFAARQSLAASRAVARQHGLAPGRTLFVQQAPGVVDQGVFHNDVIAVGHDNVLFHHEQAFVDSAGVLADLAAVLGDGLRAITVTEADLAVPDAVATYLFNSQLVTLPDDTIALVCPVECRESPTVWPFLESLGMTIEVVDLRQSMRNGGGPACLRLRVPVDDAQLAAVNPGSLVDAGGLDRLAGWVERNYRDRLDIADLADPALLEESRAALDELTTLLALGSVYDFQR